MPPRHRRPHDGGQSCHFGRLSKCCSVIMLTFSRRCSTPLAHVCSALPCRVIVDSPAKRKLRRFGAKTKKVQSFLLMSLRLQRGPASLKPHSRVGAQRPASPESSFPMLHRRLSRGGRPHSWILNLCPSGCGSHPGKPALASGPRWPLPQENRSWFLDGLVEPELRRVIAVNDLGSCPATIRSLRR
jgi:hypothetical protein